MLDISASSAYLYLQNVDELRRRTTNELADLNHAVMERAVGDVALSSVRACVLAGGRHFEHMM